MRLSQPESWRGRVARSSMLLPSVSSGSWYAPWIPESSLLLQAIILSNRFEACSGLGVRGHFKACLALFRTVL